MAGSAAAREATGLAAGAPSGQVADAKKNTQRRIVEVGPTRKLKTPGAAARVARDGDHVKIDPGTYSDCAVWRAGNLILEGLGSEPVDLTGAVCEDQAIWLIAGNDVQIRNIKFSGAHNSHNTGAGIKMRGRNLYVYNSVFLNNENGILTGVQPRSLVYITNSRFVGNGKCQPECAHGIYIGHVGRLRVTGSHFEGQKEGHHIKSRALLTEVMGNRIVDGANGSASMSIDMPNGGSAVISGNFIEQGPHSPNHGVMVSIGEEIDPKSSSKVGRENPSKGIIFQDNVFVNSHPNGTTFIRNRTKVKMILRRNRFNGRGSPTKGPARTMN